MVNEIRMHIVKALAQGEFISGQELGKELNISRTTVSKHIKALIEMDIDIYSVKGKGYKLAKPINLLNKIQIESLFPNYFRIPNIEIHETLDSTNSYLLRQIPKQLNNGQVCLAEYQSAGRGRRGRQWISPFGSQIFLSMYWYLEQGISAAMGLSLVAALAVSDAIGSVTNISVQLKWPNDIYLEGVKLAGILIDLEGQALEPSHSVIGIGLNLTIPEQAASKIDQDWTDLQNHCNEKIDRNLLVARIIFHLLKRLEQHKLEGLSSMINEWHDQDYYLNKKVILLTGDKVVKGICRGVNSQGALNLETDGKIKPIYGGEVSLRGDE